MADDESWLTLNEVSFRSSRQGLVGPSSWKLVTPVVGRRYPDEVFSFIRGMGLLGAQSRQETEVKIQELRTCPNKWQGWQPFLASLLPKQGLSHQNSRITDFFQNEEEKTESCRRIAYKLNEEKSGIDVRIQVNLPLAFSMMLHGIRYPALGYEGDWRLCPTSPMDLRSGELCLAPFQLLDNKSEPRHRQPKLLHALRPEQLRSLYWMVQQEEQSILTMIYRCYWQRFRPDEAAPKSLALDWTLDCRIIASFRAHGGILADEMGYGKTVLAIALHEVRKEEDDFVIPEVDQMTSFPCSATLICIPPHLHAQWKNEINKFVGKKCKVLDLSRKVDFQKCTVRSLMDADVVLCNYDLLRSMPYLQRRQQLANMVCPDKDMWSVAATGARDGSIYNFLEKLQMGISSFRSAPMSHAWTGELDKASDAKSWGNLRFPVLEMFFFRRVIFDELHELVGDPKGDLSAMHHLRSSHFWGLTATPLLSSTRHVSQMAALLRIDVAGPGSHSLLDSDLVLVENCQRFLDACVRRNTAEVPKIQVKQHLRLVKHTPQERALYLAACADAWSNSLQRNRRLLILCSHFSEQFAFGNLRSLRKKQATTAKATITAVVWPTRPCLKNT